MTTIPDKDKFIYSRSPAYNRPQSISGKIDEGYFVNPPYPDKSGYYNGTLAFQEPGSNGKIAEVGLFISDLSLSSTLSGSTAQSHQIRQFYAHNINTPQMIVTCQARSNYEYNYVAEYVRMTQIYLTTNYEPADGGFGLITFVLEPFDGAHHNPANQNNPGTKLLRRVYRETQNNNGTIQTDQRQGADGFYAGKRSGFSITCYITNISRLAEVEQNAYEFQFAVTIVSADSGLPFSATTSATSATEGIQWTYEEIDNAVASFVTAPKITVNLPHQKKKGSGNPNPTPSTPASDTGGDITSTINGFINSLASLLTQ